MSYINVTKANFDETIQNNEIVFIDFWAEWCGPCKQFGPIFESIADDNLDLTFAKINTDEEQELAGQFGIRSIPTMMILKEGIIVFNQAGVVPEEAFGDLIRQVKELDMDMVREQIAKEQAGQS